eukprot:TRINITY_DN14572_c0_g1_i1.p2 TRINITY_DN14572_c0_g1~~TRINITY_DN14572_c0_g1_i1.p2  ORF type:complete len:122 (+),score=20.05 TRINITY_DN14572_c0_g1_i1:206-571(+)
MLKDLAPLMINRRKMNFLKHQTTLKLETDDEAKLIHDVTKLVHEIAEAEKSLRPYSVYHWENMKPSFASIEQITLRVRQVVSATRCKLDYDTKAFLYTCILNLKDKMQSAEQTARYLGRWD